MPPVTWVDGVTPLNAVNMSTLESLANKGVANGYPSLDSLGDLALSASQQIKWGADTNLYRAAAGQLKTDGMLLAGGQIFANLGVAQQIGLNASGVLVFGSAQDTNLYRAAAGTLKTDNAFQANGQATLGWNGSNYTFFANTDGSVNQFGGQFYQFAANDLGGLALYITGDTWPRFRASNSGALAWSGGGTTPPDTNLYRVGAQSLRTDAHFHSANTIYANVDTQRVHIGAVGPGGVAAVNFGSAEDTNLYRAGASTLKTDGDLFAVGAIRAAANGTTGMLTIGDLGAGRAGINFGSAADTNLYRWQVGWLQTDGGLHVRNGLMASAAAVGWAFWTQIDGQGSEQFRINHDGSMSWGGGAGGIDTNLYRSGAGMLQTDSQFRAVRSNSVDGAMCVKRTADATITWYIEASGKQWFGDGTNIDTNLYRAGAGTLKTDSEFIVAKNRGPNTETALQLNVGGTLWRVYVGALDSGGVGYRMLRIPNNA